MFERYKKETNKQPDVFKDRLLLYSKSDGVVSVQSRFSDKPIVGQITHIGTDFIEVGDEQSGTRVSYQFDTIEYVMFTRNNKSL
jgi:hypothetical protein